MENDVYEKIINMLRKNNVNFEEMSHASEGETKRVSEIRGNSLSQSAKAMVVQINFSKKDKQYYLAVVPGNRKLDFSKISRLFNAQKALLAPPEKASLLTNCAMGTVPPISFNENLNVLVDEAVTDHHVIYFNAGRLDRSISLKTDLYLQLAQARIVNITIVD
ncbi:YbaK/prolyl-tRNA synthetase associated domain-containing protein [Fictibacillus macauensis ZFHKF-1]|uniref:YbaK/prolyl-tRNA synthetase associated domain-containing protein n=1 Tax=Fictibacillus macauensis ZFHKF-1 TaxID=1196324 RepID=I8AMV4_9BACL|nr:YbaK/EbsC family protein [Fictibacillus macauensis]EIT87034.1 YbaK/prolyl-tRNA synthetase associated domain-containing protein [Fictibacillus macauensis ZFHKF-1]